MVKPLIRFALVVAFFLLLQNEPPRQSHAEPVDLNKQTVQQAANSQAVEQPQPQPEVQVAVAPDAPKPEPKPVPAPVQKSNRQIGQEMAASYGWTGSQWLCLEKLWTNESNWRTTAHNPSGAHGIPQALPASKMASMGSDYLINPRTQISWGLRYIKSTYGSPCNALGKWNSRTPHWY